MESFIEEEREFKVRDLIQNATSSTSSYIDLRILKAIKRIVRDSDSELRHAARFLMDLMKSNHSQVRYLSLLIIDELFMRSKLFRTVIVENFDQLLTYSVGFRRNLSLPEPQAVATRLRKTAIEFLVKWNESFGIHYRQIRIGFDYLKNTLRLQFPNPQENATRAQQVTRGMEMMLQETLRNKLEKLRVDFSSIKEEIKSTTDEIGQCLDIVSSSKEEIPCAPIDDEDFVEFRSFEFRQLRLHSLKEGEKVHENTENKTVFDALRELYKLVNTKHVVTVQEWISVLIRVDMGDNRFRDSMLKEFIDIRNCLLAAKKNCEELGCTLSEASRHEKDEDEDIWEEYKVESFNIESSVMPSKQAVDSGVASSSKKEENLAPPSKKGNPKANKSREHVDGKNIPSSVRSKLLDEAPVIELGSEMNTWNSNRVVMANYRGLEIESHWGRVDNDAVIPAKNMAELNLKVSFYKEKPVDIQPCRAPISKTGGLCQRKDLKVCPFHGLIVPRDDQGNLIPQSSSADEIAPDSVSDSDLLRNLAKQAVKNVRGREIDERSLKRAKVAKVREHNNDVLRDAAIASTSRSAHLGEEFSEGSSGRNKKQTLGSMLVKKVTRKDRICQKLSNIKRSKKVIKEIKGGDDAYRDAFPNQW
ncbi:hypothetical protein ACFE04_016472 [Oxalis oulophora]